MYLICISFRKVSYKVSAKQEANLVIVQKIKKKNNFKSVKMFSNLMELLVTNNC